MPPNTKQSPAILRYLYVFILLSIFSLLSVLLVEQATAQIVLPQTIQANRTSETSAYVDMNGLRMEYPSNWTKIQSNVSASLVAPPQEESGWDVASLTLRTEDTNMTMNEFASWYISFYKLVKDDFEIGTSSETNIKGHPARMLTFTSTSNSSSEDNILVLVELEDNKYAALTYESPSELYSHYLPVVQKMINSLEILPISSQAQTPLITNVTGSTNSSTFEDPYHGVRIEFPSDWTYRLFNTNVGGTSVKQMVVFYSQAPSLDDPYQLIFAIGVDDLGASEISLEDYTTSVTNRIRQSNNITQEGLTTIADKQFYQIIYTSGGGTRMQVWTVEDGLAYVITVLSEAPPSVFNSYLPVVQKMINSLEILPISSQAQTQSITNVTGSTNFVTYENATSGIKIDYPSDWEIEERSKKPESLCHYFIQCTVNSVVFGSPQEGFSDRIREYVRITSGFFAGDMNLDDIVQLFTGDHDETLSDYVPIGSDRIFLRDNSSAYMTEYQYNHPEFGVINAVDIFTLKGNSAYSITALIEPSKYSHYLPVVQKMINSLEILPISSQAQTQSITNVTGSTNFETYENATNGIKIDYPSDWSKSETDLPPAMRENAFGVDFVSTPESNTDNVLEKMEIFTASPVENQTLNEWFLTASEDIRKSPNNHNITMNSDMLGDLPANTISYMSTEAEKVQKIELYASRYERLYMVTIEIQPSEVNDYLPTIRKMINSFEVPSIPFSNKTAGISFDYPFDWKSMEGFENDNITGFVPVLGSSYNKSFYFVSPDFEEMVQVLIENLPSGISLDDYVNATTSVLREEPNPANNIESVRAELSGLDAKRLTYDLEYDGIDRKETQVMTLNQGKVYTLLYSAPSSKYSDNLLKNLNASLTINQ